MTEEELRELLKSWEYEEEDATAYAKLLWANRVRLLSKIANAEQADLAAILAGQEPVALAHKVAASDMIAKAKGASSSSGQAGAGGGAGTAEELAQLRRQIADSARRASEAQARLEEEMAQLRLQQLTASCTTRTYNDIGKATSNTMEYGLIHTLLSVNIEDKLQQLVEEVLKAFAIPKAEFECGKGAYFAQSTGSKRPRHASNSEEETQEETLTTLAPNAVCLPGWSLLDLVLMRAPPGVVNDLREDVHMQPVAFALLSALAKALAFAGDFKDTHSSSMLTNPAAKPDSVLISPAWTEPTWSVLVASFEFKLRNTRSDLENMLGQLVQSCMAALHHQPHRQHVFGVGLTMNSIEVFRFQRPDRQRPASHLPVVSTGQLPFSLHATSQGFKALASLLSFPLGSLGMIAQSLPQDVQLRSVEDEMDWPLSPFYLQLLQIGGRHPHGSFVYWLRKPPKEAGFTGAGSSSVSAEAVLKISDTTSEADILLRAHGEDPMPNVVRLVASGTCTHDGRVLKAMVVQPFARRLTQTDPVQAFEAVACDVAQAIGGLFARGILHRDLTPNNFGFVEHSGQYRGILFDFSAATTVTDESALCLDESTFRQHITGTLAWAPYSVLMGGRHSVSSQLEGLFISLHGVAVGPMGHQSHHTHRDTMQAWANERLAQFASPTPAFANCVPEPLRPLITQLHSLFWKLSGEGAMVRAYNSNVKVEEFVSAVRCATTMPSSASSAATAGS